MSQLPYKKPYTDLIRYPPIHHQVEDKSPIIYEAIEVWTEEEILRNNDLLYFIQDFVNSPEYHDYIQRKVEKHFEDKSTQCNTLKGGSDLNDLEITILSEKANKVWRFTKQLKKFEEDEHNRRHDTAVKIIRQKIKEVRVLYLKRLAHVPEDEERKLKWLDEYAKENDIDLTHLKKQNKIRIFHRTVKLWKEEKLKKCRQQENLMKIVQKLLNEYQRDKEIDAMKNRSYDYKVRRKEKILKGMEVVGTKIVLRPRFPEVITEEVEEEEVLEEEVKVKKEKGKKGKKDKRDKMKGKKDKKKDKKGKGSKSIKTSKKTKKGKEDEFKLPLIPIVNPRERIQLKNFSQLKELVGLFEKFEDILEEERYRKGLLREVYPKDFDFALVPEMIKFSGGVEGKTYKKMVKIINKSSKVKRCRILRVTFEDDFDRALFKFEAIGIQRLISGGFFTLTVHYYPPDDNKTVEGIIYFLTWDDNVPNYAQFTIPIKVLPKHSHLQISPINIDFGKIPFWKTKKNPSKTIKLNNKGQKECTIVIKKIANPWDSSPIEEEPTAMIQSLIMECVDYKFHNFQFQDYYLKIQPNQDLKIPITFQNYTHLGFYMEKYLLEIYEDQIWTGSQELTTQIEIKNHFIFAEPPILDFGVCVFNSLYQLNIEIRNTSTATRTLTLKFPSSLQNCLTSDSPNIFVAPQQRRVVWIKFLPRETIKKYCQYFDGQTGILEFPIHVHVISKNYIEIPDVKVAVFAILTEMNDLSLVPSDVGITECVDDERLIMHMGVVTTDETGVAYVNLTNNTEVCQVYGFLDLPEYVTVSPDHGFGQILPHEVKILKVELAVEPGDFHDRTIEKIFDFKLTVDTLYNRGRTKPTINNRRLKRSMEMVLQELKIDKNRDLHLEMLSSLSHLHQILAEDSNTSVEDVSQDIEQYLQHLQGQEAEENIEETIKYCIERVKSNVLHVLATIRQPRYRFDYQFVEFPDTACGSYSLAFINLRGVYPKFSGKFVIGRDNPEMEVEPCCGRVENGGVVRLSLVSRPQVPEDLVLERTKLLKTRDVYLRKLEEMERARLEALQKELTGGKKKKQKKKGKKEKKPSKKSSKSSKKSKETEVKKEYCPPLIKVEDKEVVIEDLDLLPAEMFQWMSMNPYRIDGHFTCTLTYDDGQKEVLYFDATCRVIIPNFITNLTSQKIDFGAVTIGNRATKDVMIQNITEKPIRVQIEEVSPLEKLSIVKEPKIRIPPGLMLKVPISFAPEGNEKFQEFLEIRSGPTIFPICLTGEGVEPNFTVTPTFNVYRIETKEKDINELTFEVVNKSIANIILSLEKVLEIEGLIKEIPKPKEAKKSGKKDKGSKKSEKKDKGSKKGQKKTEGNSNELTEDEVESIKQYFRNFEGDSNFDFILGEPDQDRLVVNGQSKKTFKIRFGKPSLLWQSRQPKIEKEKKKSGKTKSKSTKSSKTKSKSSKSSKASQKKKGKQYTYYIVKYNLLLGVNFVRDFIVIACFL